jgi:hypothetical protein
MGRTIGRHIRRGVPLFEYTANCAYCGALRYRSDMAREPDGRLRCPRHGNGRDRLTLDRAQINNAWTPPVPPPLRESVAYHDVTDVTNFTPASLSPYLWIDPSHPRLSRSSEAEELPVKGKFAGGLLLTAGYTAAVIDRTTYAKPVFTFTSSTLYDSGIWNDLQFFGNGQTGYEFWAVTKLTSFAASNFSYLFTLSTAAQSSTVNLNITGPGGLASALFRTTAATYQVTGSPALVAGETVVWRAIFNIPTLFRSISVGDSYAESSAVMAKPYGRQSVQAHIGCWSFGAGNGLIGDIGPILATPLLSAEDATSLDTYLTNWMT